MLIRFLILSPKVPSLICPWDHNFALLLIDTKRVILEADGGTTLALEEFSFGNGTGSDVTFSKSDPKLEF